MQRRRRARSIPPYAVCDACGQSTLLLRNQCSHCAAPLLTDHVYVRPGLRGDFDPRLQRTWAQFVGGARVCAMLPLFSLWAPELGGYERQAVPLICLQLPLGTVGLVLLSIDRRLRSKSRLEKLDKAIRPLCHHCLRSLHGKPATGVCPHCKRAYRAIELAGGC